MHFKAKIKTALRLSQEDQKTITHLQKEMEKTWKMVYMSQEKEGRAKENITLLKEELATLSRLVERGASLSVSQENDVKQLRVAREELQRQVEEQSVQISLLEGKLFEQNNYHVDLREQVAQHLATITDVKDRLAAKESQRRLFYIIIMMKRRYIEIGNWEKANNGPERLNRPKEE